MSMRDPLNEKQLDVLRWIGEGCPPQSWRDHTYKTLASALQSRGLVMVARKRRSWSAVITDDGRHYLANGRYPEQTESRGRKTVATAPAAPSAAAGSRVEMADLLDRLRVASGVVRVEDPDPELRAAHRRAISAAITSAAVPEGYRLRYSGRDHGDLIIRLVATADIPQRREPLSPIPIPDTLEDPHDVVSELAERDDGVGVSDSQRLRALRILQGIAEEAGRRGYDVGLPPDGEPGVRIGIGEDSYDLTIREEDEQVDHYPDDEIQAKKYAWQRVSGRTTTVPSGRLVLQMDDGYPPLRWADRKRWSLVDKLPEMFKAIEDRARTAREAREQKRERIRRRREQWEAAIPEARRQYLENLNRTRALEQADAWRAARDLRDYAAEVQARADGCQDDDERRRVAAWAGWARREADRMDPLRSPEGLSFLAPEEIAPEDLDRYMPPGMTVRYPPDEPSARWR